MNDTVATGWTAERVPAPGIAGPGASAVSWGAILGGAAGAAALSLILLLLGSGLGLSSVSPWTDRGASAGAIGFSTIAWITFTQLAASAMGGYLAGRLRTKWASVHTDEVYFRDTAHGFLAWAVATLLTAALLTSAIGSALGGGAKAGAALAGGAATAASAAAAGGGAMAAAGNRGSMSAGPDAGGNGYFMDSLFRPGSSTAMAPAAPASAPATGAPADATGTAPVAMAPAPAAGMGATPTTNGGPPPIGEVTRIFANGLRDGALPAEDSRYVGQLVAQRTGLSQQDAEKRVNDTFAKAKAKADQAETQARAAADEARKTAAYTALWMFISLLIGAFVASLAATFGGRQRDL